MPRSNVVTIGNFDGVHLGHRALLAHARRLADARGGRVVAVTFHPHPASVLRPGSEPPAITSLDERAAELRRAGADEVAVLEPSPEMLAVTAGRFLDQLVERFQPAAIVEGPDFHFGKDREGTPDFPTRHAAALGCEAHIVAPVTIGLSDQLLVTVRSSLVRWLLAQGRMLDVTRCLGRPFQITAPVVAGERRGRTIGVPTANLDLTALPGRALPAHGVYAGVALTASGTRRPAAISVGVKPTFNTTPRTIIEAHLLDCSENLYNQPLQLTFHRWLREQQPFPALAALKAQLDRDIRQTRAWFDAGRLADHPAGVA